MPKHILIILIACITTSLEAQEFPEFARRAIENNYGIRIFRNLETIASNNNTAGNAGMLPSVSADGNFARSINNTRQQFFITDDRVGTNAQTDNFNARLTANWTLFSGFRIQATRDQLGYLEELGGSDTRFLIEQTLSDLAGVYFQLTAETSVLRNLRATLDVSLARLTLEQSRKTIGAGTALSYNQALSDYQSDSAAVLAEEALITTLAIRLNTIASNTTDRSYILPDEISYPGFTGSLEQVNATLASASEELKAAQLNELLAETQRSIADSRMYPEVNAFGGYAFSRVTNEVGFLKSSRNYGPEFGLSVRFNLFNGGTVQTARENADINAANAKLNSELILAQLKSSAAIHFELLTSLDQRIRLAEQTADVAQENLSIGRAQLAQGVISGIDFRAIQLETVRAQNAVVALKQAHCTSVIQLLRLSGQLTQTFLR
ncbi:MAG: TolC family protein [Flavobacteriales bacterium]